MKPYENGTLVVLVLVVVVFIGWRALRWRQQPPAGGPDPEA